ncbi:chaperone modulator CbpM [Variovorax terrae]|uniref:Chaperone modulator CbpM n=1 Tax=Variovorax terrae TaxID=2923278 RepID=A0A9X1VVS6_9BURK|nr:chaperone modulator CbpM [Variovorax terrae]MCJ0762929.1 chaperone modulator CbpM [Variovorax terrae]
MHPVSVTTTVVSASASIDAGDLAHACGADIGWIVQLVELGIVEAPAAATPPEQWRFHDTDLQRALDARRLERDFGMALDSAALVLDLRAEVRRLKALLRAHGLHDGR